MQPRESIIIVRGWKLMGAGVPLVVGEDDGVSADRWPQVLMVDA